MSYVVLAALVFAGLVVVMLIAAQRLIVIAEPNEAVVLTGRRSGYRIVRGGRTFRIPIIEKTSRIPLRTIPIEVRVENAFSKGGIPLEVVGIANVKIASEPAEVFNNAVERLLDLHMDEIHRIAKDTLEGNLRGVLATLSPEEVNEDRLKFANELIDEADTDLKRLGLQLDMLKIQNVTDKVGYLDSIGRAKSAEILRVAAVAEAEREAETLEKQAESRQRAEVAHSQAEMAIASAANDLRIKKITLEQEALAAEAQRQADMRVKEAEAKQRADVARATADTAVAEAENLLRVRRAELDQAGMTKEKVAVVEAERVKVLAQQQLEEARVEYQRRKLRVDVVEPAEADKRAAELRAEAEATLIRERGLAQVEVFRQLSERVRESGEEGLRVYLAEKLPELFEQATGSLDKVSIERLIVFDGDGGGLGRVANQKPAAVLALIEQLASGLGIDVGELIRGRAAGPNGPPSRETVAVPGIIAREE